jgi:hypothetical protein
LYAILTKVINAFVPLSRRYYYKRNHLPRYIRVAILRKKKAWRRWRNSPNNINKKLYNRATRNCSNLLHQHRAAEKAELLRSSSHTFFNLVSRRLHPTSNGITLCEVDKVLTDAQDIADCFAAEFSKNFSTFVDTTALQHNQPKNNIISNQKMLTYIRSVSCCSNKGTQLQVRTVFLACSIGSWRMN